MTAKIEVLSTGTRATRVTSLHAPTPLPAPLIREGVLELAGGRRLHHHGELADVRVAWRLTGPDGAPVVCALGGISSHRRVCLTTDPRAGWWAEHRGAGQTSGQRSLADPEF